MALDERLVSEIAGNFFGRQIDIGKDDDAGVRLFDDLSSPTCFAAGIEALAALETHLFEHRYQVRKRSTARAVSMVVMIGPTEADTVLPLVLNSSSPVAR